FEGIGTEDFHTFLQVSNFNPLVLDSRKIVRGDIWDGGFSHIFRKSVIFSPLSWTEDKGIIRRMTPYDWIVATISGLLFWPSGAVQKVCHAGGGGTGSEKG